MFYGLNLDTLEIPSSVTTIKAMDPDTSELFPPFYGYTNTLQEIILRGKTSIPSRFENGWNISRWDEETDKYLYANVIFRP